MVVVLHGVEVVGVDEVEASLHLTHYAFEVLVVACCCQHGEGLADGVEAAEGLAPEGVGGSLSEIAAADEELGVGVAFEGLPEQNVGYAAYGVLYVARVDEGEGLLVGLWHAERVPGRMAVGGGDAVAVGVAWAEVSESGHVVGCLAASGGEGLACGWDADACGVGCVDEADEGGLQVCAAGPADVAAFGAAVTEG